VKAILEVYGAVNSNDKITGGRHDRTCTSGDKALGCRLIQPRKKARQMPCLI
jgi:hypothetical protein